MGLFRKSSASSPVSLEAHLEQETERIAQASARSHRAKEQADQLGEQINQIMGRLEEKGIRADRLKWRLRARFRYAHTSIEVAHQEAHKAEQKFARLREKMHKAQRNDNPGLVLRYTRQIAEASETIAAKSEAYLQAVQSTLALWTDLEEQTANA